MSRQGNTKLGIFTSLLRFYPREYRDLYGEEMLQLTAAMLHAANSRSQRMSVISRLASDFVHSVMRQNIIAYKQRLNQRPRYLRYSSLAAIALLTPYMFVCAYNLIIRGVLHRKTLLMQWEAHGWAIYCIVLPVTAFMIISLATVARIYKGLTAQDEMRMATTLTQDALMLGVPLTLLTTVALL